MRLGSDPEKELSTLVVFVRRVVELIVVAGRGAGETLRLYVALAAPTVGWAGTNRARKGVVPSGRTTATSSVVVLAETGALARTACVRSSKATSVPPFGALAALSVARRVVESPTIVPSSVVGTRLNVVGFVTAT